MSVTYMNGKGQFLCNTKTTNQMTLSPKPEQGAWRKMANCWHEIKFTFQKPT